jgi:hypothetical protein
VLEKLKQHQELIDGALQMHVDGSERLKSELEESVKVIDTCQLDELKELKAILTTEQKFISVRTETLSDWKQCTSAQLNRQVNDVEKFLDEELLKDVPTGTTPQRREFNYPRSLVQTRQHDVILEEFRTKYFANEAQNTSLPSDSEFFSETPQTVSAASSVLNLEWVFQTAECHNTSGDSAISSVSSNFEPKTENVLNNKENQPQKQFTAPKSRIGTKSASDASSAKVLSSSNRNLQKSNSEKMKHATSMPSVNE